MGKVHASLFSGLGACDLAATWMGWDNAFWCEIDGFCRVILSYWFPKSKGYGNIKETDFTSWRGKIDVLTGGFPCQPFSVAGQRKGAADDRYLWPEMLRAIREIRPTWVIGENVGGITSMVQPGSEVELENQTSLFEESDKQTILEQQYVVETVCRDLEQEGYSIQPIVIPACAVGAPHRRDRVWFIAHRADAGTESLQREGEDGVYRSEITSDSNGDDAGRSEHGAFRCQTEESERAEGKREWIRRNTERNGEERATSESKRDRGYEIRQDLQPEQPVGQRVDGIGGERDVTDTYRKQLEDSMRTWDWGTEPANPYCKRTWSNFPTQPAICRGNDGLPFDVDDLTIPFTKWSTGSIKGYGNAIVPQVVFEIFKAIEKVN